MLAGAQPAPGFGGCRSGFFNRPKPMANAPDRAGPAWGVIRSFVFSSLKGSTVCLIIVFTSLVRVVSWLIIFYPPESTRFFNLFRYKSLVNRGLGAGICCQHALVQCSEDIFFWKSNGRFGIRVWMRWPFSNRVAYGDSERWGWTAETATQILYCRRHWFLYEFYKST